MKFISLFTGIGGFDLGFERAGMECVGQVEIDKHCLEVLSKHWPDVPKDEDVRNVGKRESADLICGGFPCQDLSVAGKREGLAGERSGLWFEFHRIIEINRPRWVVIENVPGLLSSNGGRDFAVILRGLVECGYGVSWRVLDSQYFGVAQRRRRVFIVGSLGSGCSAEVLFERQGLPGDTPPSRETREGIAKLFTVRTGKEGGGKGYLESNNISMALSGQPRYLTINLGNSGANQNNVKETDVLDTLDTGQTQAIAWNWQSGGDVRLGFGKPMLQANQVPAVGIRRLTPTECERLQGFPDGWTSGISDTQRYRQLGNAVTVNVIEWIGKRIMESDQDLT